MKIKKLIAFTIVLLFSSQLIAGDYLNNTNQSVRFLRNPARGGAIGIDGVYYNPAGVSFLSDGWHVQFNWQQPKQERNTQANYGPLYGANYLNPGTLEPDGSYSKYYLGKVNVPIQPSLYLTYNTNGWAFQFGAGILGGGGKCKFDSGVASFESMIAGMGMSQLANNFGGYSLYSKIEGESYLYGVSLAVSKRLLDNLSVSVGVRTTIARNAYKGEIRDITFRVIDGSIINYPNSFVLDTKQKGTGIAPIIGIDYMPSKYVNLSAKYEFKTKLKLKSDGKGNNDNFNAIAQSTEALNKFLDGQRSYSDTPATLSLATQITPLEGIRIMGEYKYYWDKSTTQWNSELLGNTNEFLCGVEWDITDRIEVSAGYQRTLYSQKDANFSDLSFNLNGNSVGFGIGYKVNSKITLNAAYFRTDYNRRTVTGKLGAIDTATKYIRKNRVFGLGVDFSF